MTRRADAATTSKPGLLRALGLIDVVAGLWLLSAPFVLGYPHAYPHQRALFNDLIVGALVSMLAVLHLLQWNSGRWASEGSWVSHCGCSWPRSSSTTAWIQRSAARRWSATSPPASSYCSAPP